MGERYQWFDGPGMRNFRNPKNNRKYGLSKGEAGWENYNARAKRNREKYERDSRSVPSYEETLWESLTD